MELPIAPVVEMYPIEAVLSKQEKVGAASNGQVKHAESWIRKHLEAAAGIYALFDSLWLPDLRGQDRRKQNLWKEMTNAFNRAEI